MSTFQVPVVNIVVGPHPDADALEIAQVGAYCSIVRKGQFRTGDMVAYIPEQSLVPPALLAELGLTGRLAGPGRDRVKAIRLRGVLSQGLCCPARSGWSVGQDVAAELGVTKYVPPVPSTMNGTVFSAGLERTIRYDIENIKRYPDLFTPGEPVVFTEKVHGTWAQLGVMSPSLAVPDHGRLVVSSKGLASRGLAFVPDSPDNLYNVYLRVARHLDIEARVTSAFGPLAEPVFVLGEVFGAGVQDLGYGASTAQDDRLGFRVFDVYRGRRGHGTYLSDAELDAAVSAMGLQRAPVVYRGPFSGEGVRAHTAGRETVSGTGCHLREGVVIRPQVERRDLRIGRAQLKSVSDDYLLRKGGTEFN